jgi:hypothetical protein
LALAAVVVLGGSSLAAGSTTYNISQAFGGASVTGTITTDGTLGTLSQSDVLSWDLTVDGLNGSSLSLFGSGTSGIFPSGGPITGNSGFWVYGSDLSASGPDLLFNFSGGDGGYILSQLNGFYSSGEYYFCDLTNPAGPCLVGASAITTIYTDTVNSVAGYPESGDQIIGTAVTTPEPGTLALLLSGLGGIGAFVRRKKATCS